MLVSIQVWEFFKENIDTLIEKLGRFGCDFQEIIERLTSQLLTEEEERDAINFFKENPITTAHLSINQSIESIGRRREIIIKEGH